jgi:acetylornithine deacetylase/succinyl-diaminopimelate desuccinylase-like protein
MPSVEAILANAKVVKTLDDIKADDARAFEEQKRITEIPAPPYKEKLRAEYYQKRMQELGFKDAAIDAEGNVIALRKGSGGGRPKLVVSAHLDTVFPEGTDVTVKEKDGAILAPGIGDDSRGLAALLSLIKAVNANEIATVGDILFVGTVGEEELGNLRGVKALFRDNKDIDGFISIDGLGITRVVNQATGSHRYEFIFRGPGGHSFQEFGLPSAIHAMGRAIAKISEFQTHHLHGRYRCWRHLGQCDCRRSQDGGRHAFGFDRGTAQARGAAARSGQAGGGGRKRALEVRQDRGRDQTDRRPAGRDRGNGFPDRAGHATRGRRRHPRAARHLCRFVHRFQHGDVARYSRRHHRRWR